MHDFLRRKKDENLFDNIGISSKEEIEEQVQNDTFDFAELYEQLEYTNSYLAQIALTLGELTKQQTIANALHILDSEYNNADSIMDVDEILQKKYALLGSIFIDYSVKEKEENDNE